MGTPQYAEAYAQERAREESKLLSRLSDISKLQSSWALLYYCAVPLPTSSTWRTRTGILSLLGEECASLMTSCLWQCSLGWWVQTEPLGAFRLQKTLISTHTFSQLHSLGAPWGTPT